MDHYKKLRMENHKVDLQGVIQTIQVYQLQFKLAINTNLQMEVDFYLVVLEKIQHHIKKWEQMDKPQDLLAHKHILQDQIKN